jgi:DNA-directed RNA polymerase specialized sigma24 family protein
VIEKLIDKVGFLRKLDRRGLVNYIITAAKNTAYNYCRDKKKELDFRQADFVPVGSLILS